MEFSRETRRLALQKMQERDLDLLIIGEVLRVLVWHFRRQLVA